MEQIFTWSFTLNSAVGDECWSSSVEIDVTKEEFELLDNAKKSSVSSNINDIPELSDMAAELMDMFLEMEEAEYKEENPSYKGGLAIEIDI